MINARTSHTSIAIANKLYILCGDLHEGTPCEYYASFSKQFVALKTPSANISFNLIWASWSVCVGRKIMLLSEDQPLVAYYDVDTEEWSEEHFELTGSGKLWGGILKIPQR